MSKNQPAHEIRLASIKATVWSNSDGGRSWFSISLSRSYRDGDQWKDTTSFRRDDLPLVSKASEMAYAWIWQTNAGLDVEKQHADS